MGNSHSSTYLASTTFALLVLGVVWHKVCTAPPQWIKELAALGQPRKQKLAGTAVVCGGRRVEQVLHPCIMTGNSIAGTIAARVLADHFERVILVDPELTDMEKPKTRIIQYNAAHILLKLFTDGARRLWPNFDNELMNAGGRLVCADYQMHYSGVLVPAPYWEYPDDGFPITLVMRRSSSQKALYQLLLQHPAAANITVWPGTVRGVKTLDNKITAADVDLVVDCTGPTQAGIKWLQNAGINLPGDLRSSYKPNICYSTICFSVSQELESRLPIPSSARNTIAPYADVEHFEYDLKAASLLHANNETMQLLLMSSSEENLPRSRSEIIPFISTIHGHEPIPSWFVETLEMLCECCHEPSFDNIKIPDQLYVKYHSVQAGTLPSNFIAIGDSNLQLNPVYGQGFAKVILNAITLNTLLHSVDATLSRDFSTRYFKTNAARTGGMWDGTRLHDYAASTCEPMAGEMRDTGRLSRWFELKLLSAATKYADVASALWHICHLVAPQRALFAPMVLAKILWTQSRF